MTFNTNSNYIKPMLRGITFVMVILRGLFTTGTLQRSNWRQPTYINSYANGHPCFVSARMPLLVPPSVSLAFFAIIVSPSGNLTFCSLVISLLCSLTLFSVVVSRLACFAFFAFAVFSVNSLTLFSLVIFFTASLATIIKSICFGFIAKKLRDRLNFFTSGTPFGYDLLRHDFLLIRKLRLEPNTGPIPVSGSFYYNRERKQSKGN